MSAISIVVALIIVAASVMVIAIIRAPSGYEDRSGFHYERRE